MRVPYNTENGVILVDTDKEEIVVITDKDVIVRVSIFQDRVIISSNRQTVQGSDNSNNVLIR